MFIIFVHVIIMKMYCLISVEIDNHNAYNSKTVRRLDTKTKAKAKAKDLTPEAKAKAKDLLPRPRPRPRT